MIYFLEGRYPENYPQIPSVEEAKAWLLTEKVDVRIEPYTIGEKKYLSDYISPLLKIVKK